MPRLRTSDCSGKGITRVRRGRGFSYQDADGARIEDPEVIERIGALAIPPAWSEVWICAHANGHIQATGFDDAARKQYRYHDAWRARRDGEKFETMLEFARELPRLRRRVLRDLGRDELDRPRVAACALRLLDLGTFRIGSEEYAADNETYGVATMLAEHATVEGDAVAFDYLGKGSARRREVVRDARVASTVAALKRRRGGGPELLAYRNGRRWADLTSTDINQAIRDSLGEGFSAKDFRTWSATVLAAIALATVDAPQRASKTARKRAVRGAIERVATQLGNTPAVCRNSYIDPRVIDRFEGGEVIECRLPVSIDWDGPECPPATRPLEQAVIDLISSA